MTLSTSRGLSHSPKRGLRTPARPASASTAVPPRAGLGAVATGTQLANATAINAVAPARNLLGMCRHPDVGDRTDEEGRGQHPCGPVDLALEAATCAVPTAQSVAAAADRATQP